MSDLIIHNPKLRERKYPDHSEWIFWCPACKCCHSIPVGGGPGPRWSFNGKIDQPTFAPSLRLTCPTPEEHAAKQQGRTVCHLNVTEGRIVYHGDNPHELNGKTVPMENIPENYST